MEITYNWNFNPLESYPTSSGETDVVFMVHWQLYATKGPYTGSFTGSYTASSIGTQTVGPLQSGSVFTPFNELTKDIVFGWVTSSMASGSVDRLYASLAQQIENQINPPVLIQQAPWLNSPTTTTSTTTTTTTIE
jgi:hypothetical protein